MGSFDRADGHLGGRDRRIGAGLRNVSLNRDTGKVTFKAPGDDWYAAKVDHYRVVTRPCGGGPTQVRTVTASASAGANQSISLHGRSVTVSAVDEAGNRGRGRGFTLPCPAP
jgi:hypothetical protein